VPSSCPAQKTSTKHKNSAKLITIFGPDRQIGRRNSNMASEKATYWIVLGVLALAVTNGLVTEHRGWAGRLAARSIAMAEQASEIATGNAKSVMPDRENDDLRRVVSARVRLARVQSTLARHQAEVVRVQVEGIRARVMEHQIRAAIDCPQQNFVIDLPQPPQVLEDETF
jgi:hypothetical protein